MLYLAGEFSFASFYYCYVFVCNICYCNVLAGGVLYMWIQYPEETINNEVNYDAVI